MNLADLPTEAAVALILIIAIAAIGCIAALQSWLRISNEQKGIKKAESVLTGDAAWEDAYPHDSLQLAGWLRQKGIQQDSHLGDFIRTCWSAWLGGRPASLTELHVLVARRERSRIATRLSAGIAALLLIFGIVGTLFAIKPILENFKLHVAENSFIDPLGGDQSTDNTASLEEPEKDAAFVTENANKVNDMIKKLGGAFLPSLIALGLTILVVSCRGLYSLNLYKFSMELDRFAVNTLIPRYRVPALSEQYQEVKVTLSNVTESLVNREARFHEAVHQLENLVVAIAPSLSGLDESAKTNKEASASLSSATNSVTETLNEHFGEQSSLNRALNGLSQIFKTTEHSLTTLAAIIANIGEGTTANQKELQETIQELDKSIIEIGKNHQKNQRDNDLALDELKNKLIEIPSSIETASKQVFDKSIEVIKNSVTQLHEEQKRWHMASSGEIKSATASALAAVSTAGQNLATQATQLSIAATNIEAIKNDSTTALKNVSENSLMQLAQMGNSTKSKIDTATTALATETKKIESVVEDLSKAILGSRPTPSSMSYSPLAAPPLPPTVAQGRTIQESSPQNLPPPPAPTRLIT